MKCCEYGHWEVCIHNTLFSAQLMDGPNKLEFFPHRASELSFECD
jgi:hypothetical protein